MPLLPPPPSSASVSRLPRDKNLREGFSPPFSIPFLEAAVVAKADGDGEKKRKQDGGLVPPERARRDLLNPFLSPSPSCTEGGERPMQTKTPRGKGGPLSSSWRLWYGTNTRPRPSPPAGGDRPSQRTTALDPAKNNRRGKGKKGLPDGRERGH